MERSLLKKNIDRKKAVNRLWFVHNIISIIKKKGYSRHKPKKASGASLNYEIPPSRI